MAILGLYVAVLLFFTGPVEAGFGVQPLEPSDVIPVPTKAYICEDSEPIIEFNSNLRNINDKGDKVIDISFGLEEEFTEDWEISVIIDIWYNGAWDEDFFRLEGKACELLFRFTGKAWDKFRTLVKPTIPGKCLIEVGNYAITDFTVNYDEINSPLAVAGKFKLTAKLFNLNGEEVLCQVVEVEVSPP